MYRPPSMSADGDTCAGARGNAFALAEGELAPDAVDGLRAHALACHACRDALATDEAFLRFLQARAPRVAAPAGLRERLARLLDRAEILAATSAGTRSSSRRGD